MEEERDYSHYLQHMSNNMNELSLFAGFTLTAITVLISILPNLKSMLAQVTLFFLFTLLLVFLALIAEIGSSNFFLCRNVPPQTRRIRIVNNTLFLSLSMWNVAIILMFLLSDLTYLAIASTITYIISITLIWVFILLPFMKHRSARA